MAALQDYCNTREIQVDEWMQDIGSGLNYKRKQFNRLFEMVELGQVKLIILAHRDRLVRFGFEWFEAFCERHGTRLVVMNSDKLSPEKEMVEDLLAIVSIFSARFHGLRSYRKVLKMLVCQKIKLEISDQDAASLEFMQGKCRGLYNWLVMRLRNGEKWNFKEMKRSLQESKVHDPELNQVYGKLLAEVYYRLDGAMKAFFRRVKNGETPGFPRVRPRHCFFTLCYPACYLKIENGILILPTGGGGKHGPKIYPNVQAKLTEVPPDSFREVALSRDARGNYHASFSYHRKEEGQEQGEIVAFDLGIKTLAVGTNEQGRVYHVGGFKGSKWYNKQLDKIRSKRDRCKKKSRRYIHLSKVYKRVSEKKQNKQRDSLHKASHLIAHKLVERTVVVGDLSQRQMVMKEHRERNKYLNRAVYNDWGLSTFVMMLTYKCALYGKELVTLDERNTSKMCSGCGHKQPMPLWKRTYCCTECGMVMDRDENSAINILIRFLARRGPHTSIGKCGVLQEDGLDVAGTEPAQPV